MTTKQIVTSNFRVLVLLTCGALILPAARVAQAQSGESVLPDNLHEQHNITGAALRRLPATANINVVPLNINEQPLPQGAQGYRLSVAGTSGKLSDAALQWASVRAIKAGDHLTLTFWVRKLAPLDSHNLRAQVVFGKGSAAEITARSLTAHFPCDSAVWTKYSFPFRAATDYAAGEARLAFHFGFGPQTFELGALSLINYGPPAPLPAAASVIPADYTQNFVASFDAQVGGGAARIVPTVTPAFPQALEITVNGMSDQINRAFLGWNNIAPIRKDDVLLLTFRVRKLSAGADTLNAWVVFERNSGNFEKSLTLVFPSDSSDWQLYQIPFQSLSDYAAGQARLIFQFAFGPQKFELGGISLLNYGQSVSLSQLPKASYYPGRGDANAAWRRAANERINQQRKGQLTVAVRDRTGQPLPGATVFVQQLNHAFKFGSAVEAGLLNNTAGEALDNDIYRSRVTSHFTTTVFENDLKWPVWECSNCPFSQEGTRQALAWLRAQGLSVRGHTLIWPAWRYLPGGLQSLQPADLRRRIDEHFASILSDPGLHGQLYQWDVLNEPYTNNNVQGLIGSVPGVAQTNGVLGNQEMIRWFQLARQFDPAAQLFLNDFNIIELHGWDVRKQDYYYALIQWLRDNGAPLDGIGIQGHFSIITTIQKLQEICARYAQLGLPLALTEFDFNTPDEELQADYTRDVMTLLFSQPAFTDFLMWGFWENAHWLPLGAMYRSDWSSKPNALAYNDLLFNEWWTNESGATDSAGRLQTRGFKGAYQITACYGRDCQTVTTSLETNSAVTVTLENTPSARRSVRPLLRP